MYVVAGVSGNTGKVVADTLLSQGKKVRVVVRDAAKGEAWRARGAEVAIASIDDSLALGKALSGAEGAYLLLPPNTASNQVLADNARNTDSIVTAVEASKVAHVVFLSSIGAHHAAGTGPIRALHDAEQKLARVKANVTFVRAAYFMENWAASLGGIAGGVFPTFVRADLSIPMIATRDIGATAAKALIEGGRGKQVIELSGPREQTPREVAAIVSKLVGKEIAVQQGPEEAVAPTLQSFGLTENFAALAQEMYHGINTGHVTWEGKSSRAVRGVVSIEDVLNGLLSAAKTQ